MRKVKECCIDWGMLEAGLRMERAGIEKAKAVNESGKNLERKYLELDELANNIEEYVNNLKLLGIRVTKENDSFRTERLEYLSASITDAIADVFPDKNLKAVVSCDFKRKNAVDLRLLDGDGHVIRPSIGNGKLMQYLISFSSVSRIVESLGYHSLFVDEAFGVASENNLPTIGEIVSQKVKDGLQIVLVSQNAALYQDVARREIRLSYDFAEKKAKLCSIVDIG